MRWTEDFALHTRAWGYKGVAKTGYQKACGENLFLDRNGSTDEVRERRIGTSAHRLEEETGGQIPIGGFFVTVALNPSHVPHDRAPYRWFVLQLPLLVAAVLAQPYLLFVTFVLELLGAHRLRQDAGGLLLGVTVHEDRIARIALIRIDPVVAGGVLGMGRKQIPTAHARPSGLSVPEVLEALASPAHRTILAVLGFQSVPYHQLVRQFQQGPAFLAFLPVPCHPSDPAVLEDPNVPVFLGDHPNLAFLECPAHRLHHAFHACPERHSVLEDREGHDRPMVPEVPGFLVDLADQVDLGFRAVQCLPGFPSDPAFLGFQTLRSNRTSITDRSRGTRLTGSARGSWFALLRRLTWRTRWTHETLETTFTNASGWTFWTRWSRTATLSLLSSRPGWATLNTKTKGDERKPWHLPPNLAPRRVPLHRRNPSHHELQFHPSFPPGLANPGDPSVPAHPASPGVLAVPAAQPVPVDPFRHRHRRHHPFQAGLVTLGVPVVHQLPVDPIHPALRGIPGILGAQWHRMDPEALEDLQDQPEPA
uniref:Uncharacterized protein n=1 Tax=Anopheles atroparvus TaxID=41427 RepID=A0A182J9I7_ANOAO